MLSKGRVIAILAAALGLALPGAASAATVIGQTGPSPAGCPSSDTYLQKSVVAPPPTYSPTAYGVITSWATTSNTGVPYDVKLIILRPNPAGGADHYVAVQKDQLRTVTNASQLHTFSGVRVPIEAGDQLALFFPSFGPCYVSSTFAGDHIAFRTGMPGEPPLNTSLAYNGDQNSARLNVTAAVEPDTDRDVFGDESQDKCVGTPGTANGCPSTVAIDKVKQKGDTKVKVTVTVPGAGTLEVGSPSDPALASKAAKSLKPVTRNLTAVTKQQLKLTLKLKKSAIADLRDNGVLKLKVKAVYTPQGGPSGSAKKKRKLRT